MRVYVCMYVRERERECVCVGGMCDSSWSVVQHINSERWDPAAFPFGVESRRHVVGDRTKKESTQTNGDRHWDQTGRSRSCLALAPAAAATSLRVRHGLQIQIQGPASTRYPSPRAKHGPAGQLLNMLPLPILLGCRPSISSPDRIPARHTTKTPREKETFFFLQRLPPPSVRRQSRLPRDSPKVPLPVPSQPPGIALPCPNCTAQKVLLI